MQIFHHIPECNKSTYSRPPTFTILKSFKRMPHTTSVGMKLALKIAIVELDVLESKALSKERTIFILQISYLT